MTRVIGAIVIGLILALTLFFVFRFLGMSDWVNGYFCGLSVMMLSLYIFHKNRQ